MISRVAKATNQKATKKVFSTANEQTGQQLLVDMEKLVGPTKLERQIRRNFQFERYQEHLITKVSKKRKGAVKRYF
jgi:hypothetical protein